MCLAIRERGVTGELERRLEAADVQLERYRRRAESLHKQVKPVLMSFYFKIFNGLLYR